MNHMSHVTCHMSSAICHLSPLTCHLSPTATATATDPHPASSPTMQSKLICQDNHPPPQKNIKAFRTAKILSFAILAIRYLTRSLQLSLIRSPLEGTEKQQTNRYIAMYRLNWPKD